MLPGTFAFLLISSLPWSAALLMLRGDDHKSSVIAADSFLAEFLFSL